jgi:hypothetical protein
MLLSIFSTNGGFKELLPHDWELILVAHRTQGSTLFTFTVYYRGYR